MAGVFVNPFTTGASVRTNSRAGAVGFAGGCFADAGFVGLVGTVSFILAHFGERSQPR